MEPVTIITLAGSLVSALKSRDSVSFEDATVLQGVVDGIKGLFERGKRTCVHKTHECTFREGSCVVLLEKGEDWQIEDITSCPYRKEIKS